MSGSDITVTACGGSSAGDNGSADSAEGTASGEESEAAVSGEAQADGDTYEVVLEWLSIGNTPTEENLVKIEEAINEITVPAINCSVSLYPVELSDLASSNTLALSTGEKIIMCAIFLNETRNKFTSRLYQSLILLPYLMSWVVVSYLCYAFLSADTGMFNLRSNL